MQQEALNAADRKQFAHYQMQSEDMLRNISKPDMSEGYITNEFEEIIRSKRSR